MKQSCLCCTRKAGDKCCERLKKKNTKLRSMLRLAAKDLLYLQAKVGTRDTYIRTLERQLRKKKRISG